MIKYAETDFHENVPAYIKSVVVNYLENTASKYMIGVKCGKENYQRENPIHFRCVCDVTNVLQNFDEERICTGISNPKYKTFGDFQGANFSDCVWLANE